MNIKAIDDKAEHTNAVRLFAPDLTLPDIGMTWDAQQLVKSLAQRAGTVTSVTCKEDQDAAAVVARDIRTYVKQVKAAALEFRRPLNATAARISEVEREHLAGVEVEQKRLERLVTDFQVAEQRRVEAEERKRREETERLMRERAEAEAKAAKAAERMQTEAGLARALEAERKAAEAQAQLQAAIQAPLPTVNKASGFVTKQVLRWEVTDIAALVQSRPDLCKIEPKGSAIQATCIPERPVPGLRLWWETVTSTRAR